MGGRPALRLLQALWPWAWGSMGEATMALLVRQRGKAVGWGKSRGVKVIAQQSRASMVVASDEEPPEIEKENGVGTKGGLE